MPGFYSLSEEEGEERLMVADLICVLSSSN